jgi:hypothetical protein
MTITWKTPALVLLGLAVVAFALTDSTTASGKLRAKAKADGQPEIAAIDLVGCGSRDRDGACHFEKRFTYPAGELVVIDDAF